MNPFANSYNLYESLGIHGKNLISGYHTKEFLLAYCLPLDEAVISIEEDKDNPDHFDIFTTKGRVLIIEPSVKKGAVS